MKNKDRYKVKDITFHGYEDGRIDFEDNKGHVLTCINNFDELIKWLNTEDVFSDFEEELLLRNLCGASCKEISYVCVYSRFQNINEVDLYNDEKILINYFYVKKDYFNKFEDGRTYSLEEIGL